VPERRDLISRERDEGSLELKTLRSGENLRMQGEEASHELPRLQVRRTLEHSETSGAESGDWQRDLTQPKRT